MPSGPLSTMCQADEHSVAEDRKGGTNFECATPCGTFKIRNHKARRLGISRENDDDDDVVDFRGLSVAYLVT